MEVCVLLFAHVTPVTVFEHLLLHHIKWKTNELGKRFILEMKLIEQ